MNPLIAKLKFPRLKLAATYLSIIMIMSIAFSFAIYSISDRELRGQRNVQVPREMRFTFFDDFERLRQERLEQARGNLKQRLVAFNVITLISGGFLSYGLALRALRPIEEVIAAQDRFTSDASHEIRTPLTVMKSEIEVALRDDNLTTAETREILESNLEEIIKLESLTAGLLQLARQENSKELLSTTNIENLITEAIDQVSRKAQSKKITINQQKVSNYTLLTEPQTLTQALVIILDNAIKYSPGKSTVSISAKSTRQHHSVTIKDEGSGISEEDLPHIFDRFYRSDKARSKQSNASGYGLGLAIAKQIVDSLDGTIKVKTKPNFGTTFTIELPRK